MSQRSAENRLRHMLDHAREAVRMATGRSRGDLDQDRQFSLALTRLLEIVGEAAGRVPTEARQELSAIPWPDIVALRNRLIHGYDRVDHDILWEIIEDDLPPLIAALEGHLGQPPETRRA